MSINYTKDLYKYKLIHICYSIVLIPFWGLTLLSNLIEPPIAILICFLVTAYSLIYLKNRYPQKVNTLLLVGPTFYFIYFIVISVATNYLNRIITSPLIWIYFFYLFIFLIDHKLKKVHLNTVIITLSFLFFLVYSAHNNYYIFRKAPIINKYTPVIKLNDTLNIYDFDFINDAREKIKLNKSTKIIFVETWNETCIPCIKSILEIQDSLSVIQNIEHIYLYQFRGKRKFSNDQIFNFKHIKEKSKILIDYENNLMGEFGINSYPYFLIFNPNGTLIEAYKGYKSDYKNLILSTFKQTIKKNQISSNKFSY